MMQITRYGKYHAWTEFHIHDFLLNCINMNENAETNCNYCFVDTEYYKSLIGCMSKVNCKKKHGITKVRLMTSFILFTSYND